MQGSMELGVEELTSPATLKATFAEVVATALFVFVGVGSIVAFGVTGSLDVAFAHGFAIALLVAGIGAISGGHINPAVTFATVITGRITPTRGAMYVVAPLAAVGLEAVGPFVLVWTVFAVAIAPRGGSGIIAPLFIGLAVLVAHIVLIPLTGSGINPARTFGPALGNNAWTDHWVYWVGPLIGAAAAAITYYVLFLMPEEQASV